MTAPAPRPYVVLPAGADLEAAAREWAARGWRPHSGFRLPAEPWDVGRSRIVAVGSVRDESSAQAAMLCGVRGAGLVVALDEAAAWAPAFLADVGRLRRDVDRPAARPGRPAAGAAGDGPALSEEQRALLDLLSEGHSIAQAARRLFLSLRTANRRVAEARAVLGVDTTREAVLAYVALRDR